MIGDQRLETSDYTVLNPQDLQRLIDMITEEVVAAQALRGGGVTQCSCHSLLSECCPDRLRGVLDAGATRIGLHASGGSTGGVAGAHDGVALAQLVGGVFLGSAGWWLALSGGVGFMRHRLGPGRLRWLNRISGVALIGFGLYALSQTIR